MYSDFVCLEMREAEEWKGEEKRRKGKGGQREGGGRGEGGGQREREGGEGGRGGGGGQRETERGRGKEDKRNEVELVQVLVYSSACFTFTMYATAYL